MVARVCRRLRGCRIDWCVFARGPLIARGIWGVGGRIDSPIGSGTPSVHQPTTHGYRHQRAGDLRDDEPWRVFWPDACERIG